MQWPGEAGSTHSRRDTDSGMIARVNTYRLHSSCALIVALLSLSLSAPAQQAIAPRVAASFTDSIAQRTLACTSCHGQQGRAGPDGCYPRLAGKPAGYLYNQLINFREGRRHYDLMTGLLDPLNEPYLLEIAQHFASLDVPYSAPVPVKSSAETLRRGEQLALKGDAARQLPACVQCHGQALTGVQPATPGLLGLPRDYVNGQLGSWQTGQRRAVAPDCMATISRRLSTEDLASVSAWLASQPLPSNTRPASALPAALPMECGSAPAPKVARP